MLKMDYIHFRKHFVQEETHNHMSRFQVITTAACLQLQWDRTTFCPLPLCKLALNRSAARAGTHPQCRIPSSNISQRGVCHWWRLWSGSWSSESRKQPHPPFSTITATTALETTCTSLALPGAGLPTQSTCYAPEQWSNRVGSCTCCLRQMWHLSTPA